MKETTVWILDVHAPRRRLRLHDRLGLAGARKLVYRCKNAEEQLAELRDQPPQTRPENAGAPASGFKKNCAVCSTTLHKHIVAVSKALKIPAR